VVVVIPIAYGSLLWVSDTVPSPRGGFGGLRPRCATMGGIMGISPPEIFITLHSNVDNFAETFKE